jgi:hypothetical protein
MIISKKGGTCDRMAHHHMTAYQPFQYFCKLELPQMREIQTISVITELCHLFGVVGGIKPYKKKYLVIL